MWSSFALTLSVFFFLQSCVGKRITPVLLLKTQRSGSSWITSEINRRKGVFLSEEIFTATSVNWGDVWKEGMSYILESFKHPVPSYGRRWGTWGKTNNPPEGHFRILGATLNALGGGQFVDWDELVTQVPNLRVIVYYRSNKVKQAISVIRGNALFRECGTMVVNMECKLDAKIKVPLLSLKQEIMTAIALDDYMWGKARKLSEDLLTQYYTITYEEMMGDTTTIDRLLEWLGYDPKKFYFSDEIDIFGKCYKNCTKTTLDDLRDVIANYEEVEKLLKTEFPCLMSHFYETNPDALKPLIHKTCEQGTFYAKSKFINKRLNFFNETHYNFSNNLPLDPSKGIFSLDDLEKPKLNSKGRIADWWWCLFW